MIKRFIQSIRSRSKKIFYRIHNDKVRLNLLQAIPFWLGSIITGLIAVLFTKLFGWAEAGSAYVYQHVAWAFFFITPACFIAAWQLVKRFAPYARGSGIPQVIAAVELSNPKQNYLVDRLLSIRIIIVKIVSILITVIGGGIVGREGPTIQIGSSVFRKINQWLPKWWPKISKRNMIKAGAAAGLAAAFNTPLGGIVFAVEELTKTHISYFKTALFTAVIIAGLTAQALLGPYLYLGYPDINNTLSWILVMVVLIAMIAGLAGSAMSKTILIIFQWKSTLKKQWQHYLYIIICALILVAFAYFVDHRIFGSGKEIMTATLFTQEKYVAWYVPLLRIIGPILSFTMGGAGGVFAPALSAGASIGSLAASWLHLSANDTNLLILCGMASFLTGVTRAPFTSAILVLEMTDRHSIIFPLMLAGMVASIFAYLVDKHSFYDHLKNQYMQELTATNATKSTPALTAEISADKV